jgi:tetratricopeptide (TPR) repeat protein
MGLAATLRKTKRQDMTLSATRPEDLVAQLIGGIARGDYTFEKAQAIESRNALLAGEGRLDEEREEARKALQRMRAIEVKSGLAPDAMADIAVQMIQINSSGNDTSGYRESVQVPGQRNQTFFIVKEDGQYRLLDSGEKPIGVAFEVLERVSKGDLADAGVLLDWLREAATSESSDDKYAGSLFMRFWEQGHGDVDARRMNLAAASVLVQQPHTAQRGVGILEQARSAPASDAELENIDLALMSGYTQLKNAEKTLAAANALAVRTPMSRKVFFAQSSSLGALKRFEEAEALADKRLQISPGDIDAYRSLARNLAAHRNYSGAYEASRKITTNANSGASDLNEAAWLTLFFDRPGGPDIDDAVRAAQLNDNNPATLHTLGCLYAEVGKIKEAREVLLQAMDAQNLDEPSGAYWYAFGRIAEQYGERDIALADYAKVTPATTLGLDPISTFWLAQNRIHILNGHPMRSTLKDANGT